MAKNFRQLQIFYDLLNGARLQKADLVQQFGVSPRAIQRDISELNVFLADTSAHQSIVHTDAGYQLVSEQHELTPREVLVLIKVLLASRALNKQELNSTLRGLLQLIKTSDRKAVEPIIKNEAFFYEPVHHHQNLLNSLWDFSQAIRQKKTLVITYQRRDKQTVTRTILPEAIIFSEYYFYVVSYNEKYASNLLYRADRIQAYTTADTTITRSRADRFEDGQFRQRIQFMYPGSLITVRFQFWGIVEAALDRLPTARVVKRYLANGDEELITDDGVRNRQPDAGGSVVIEAEVFGERGVMMWLLSQGSNVRVLGPESLVRGIGEEIGLMQHQYLS